MRKLYLTAALAAAAAVGCSDDDSGPADPGDGADVFTVSITNNQFSPTPITVPLNSTVTWVWNSAGTAHNVTFTADDPDSGDRSTGSFSRVFSTAGSFPYVCTLHPGMSGAVEVTSTGGSTGGNGSGGGGGYGS